MTSITWPDRLLTLEEWAEYAEAGIPSYWIIDLDGDVSLDAFALVDGAYRQELAGATGQVGRAEPAPVTIDLPALRP